MLAWKICLDVVDLCSNIFDYYGNYREVFDQLFQRLLS